ncbi:class I SAM-dependent methyltransferase [Thiomicrorhabdus arctica]|uniref:class I SAM-dependent methyltransferase n=1 Tax=Thiomicrorhabdus arctica TaxID=131540 RepID=UPI00037CEF28|nr:class I SAM-dependent methyltransferase [Thiomicrorhabdus arctica]
MSETLPITSSKAMPSFPVFSVPSTLDAQRLFHGRGHAYPGLEHISIDWLHPVVLITLYKAMPEALLLSLADKLFAEVTKSRSVQVQYRDQPNAPIELLLGEPVTQTVVEESGLKYHISLGRAQNTGLFLDMLNGRRWVREHALDKAVLNLFAYTCGFSVAALAGGASKVVNLDMSRAALSMGRENHRLNQQDTNKVFFEGLDIFKSFGRIKKHGPYELFVCDPPSFQKGSVDIKRDYKKIIRRIPEFMKPNSLIMLCLNSPYLSEQFLHDTVARECPACEYVESISPPEVFVETMLERGLKVMIYRYLSNEL